MFAGCSSFPAFLFLEGYAVIPVALASVGDAVAVNT
jgi:hypothetical protein